MPKSHQFASPFASLSGSVFTKYAQEISQISGKMYPFHIGDSYVDPAVKMEDLSVGSFSDMHRYTRPQGYPLLLSALSERHDVPVSNIVVSAGATGGLHVLAISTLDAGDEVLILAPYWPLIAGIVHTTKARPIAVPFFGEEGSVQERLRPYLSEKTVAIYINSPNNPTGIALDKETLQELAAFAKQHDLWIWTDEVYASLCYGKEHISMRAMAPERTFSVYSFSKVYGMAGNRCGYVVCPSNEAMVVLQKATTYSYYSVSTASQIAALRVLTEGVKWLEDIQHRYEQAGQAAAEALGVEPPDGGTFLFLDLRAKLAPVGQTADDFLLRCIRRNLLLAPGASFGPQYEQYVRICFTAAPLNEVMEGIAVLKSIIDEY